MAVAVRAVGTVANGTTTVSPNMPAGTAVGDLLIMVMECNESETPTVSGWTQAPNSPQSLSGDTKLSIFYRRSTSAGSDASATAGTTDHISARIIGFTGCKLQGSPFNATAGSTDSGSSTAVSIPGVTTTVANTMIFAVAGDGRDVASTAVYGTWTNANLGSIAGRMDNHIATGGGGGYGSATGTYVGPGACGATTTTLSVAAPRTYWCGALEPELPPTVTQDSPANAATITTPTPQLLFTGTDLNHDDLRYNAQVETVPLISYGDDNWDGSTPTLGGTGVTARGQSFTGTGVPIIAAAGLFLKFNNPTGNLVAKIYAHSGTFGTSGIPTGAALAISNGFDVSTLPGAQPFFFAICRFPTQFTPTNGTNYFLVFEFTGGDVANVVLIEQDATAPTASGNSASFTTSTWTASSTTDYVFYLYSELPIQRRDELSGTDTGFTDITNGADTDPFASGDQVGYVCPSMINGNFQWRVRVTDLNAYSSWSAYRTFTVNAPDNNFFAFMG